MHVLQLLIKEDVSLDHGYHYTSFPATLGNQRISKEVPLLALHLSKSRTEATANHHVCSSGERNGAQRRTNVSICRTMILH